MNTGSNQLRSRLMLSGPSRSGIIFSTNSGPKALTAQPVAYSTSLSLSKLWLSRRSFSFFRRGPRELATLSLPICGISLFLIEVVYGVITII